MCGRFVCQNCTQKIGQRFLPTVGDMIKGVDMKEVDMKQLKKQQKKLEDDKMDANTEAEATKLTELETAVKTAKDDEGLKKEQESDEYKTASTKLKEAEEAVTKQKGYCEALAKGSLEYKEVKERITALEATASTSKGGVAHLPVPRLFVAHARCVSGKPTELMAFCIAAIMRFLTPQPGYNTETGQFTGIVPTRVVHECYELVTPANVAKNYTMSDGTCTEYRWVADVPAVLDVLAPMAKFSVEEQRTDEFKAKAKQAVSEFLTLVMSKTMPGALAKGQKVLQRVLPGCT